MRFAVSGLNILSGAESKVKRDRKNGRETSPRPKEDLRCYPKQESGHASRKYMPIRVFTAVIWWVATTPREEAKGAGEARAPVDSPLDDVTADWSLSFS